jgi:hypothetical protein
MNIQNRARRDQFIFPIVSGVRKQLSAAHYRSVAALMDREKLRKRGQLHLFSSSSPSLERMFTICFVSMKKFDTSNPTTKFCFVSWTTQGCWHVFRENNGKVFRLKKEEEEEVGGWVYYSHKGSSTSGRLLVLLGVCISPSIRFTKFWHS